MEKQNRLDELFGRYATSFPDRELVFGDGSVESKLFLIGEAPGKDEIKQKKPFVGKAGQNLTEFLNEINLSRLDIYITNVIKYKLSKINPETKRESNRPAQRYEIESGIEFLHEEINTVDPDIIVTLGNVPLKAVMNDVSSNISIGNMHGEIHTVNINNRNYKLFPLYHPASIIYNQSLKKIYINDVKKLSRYI